MKIRLLIFLYISTAGLASTVAHGQPDPCLGKKYLSFSLSFNDTVVRHFNKWLESDVNSSTNNFLISQTPSYCGLAYDSLIWILITGNELPPVFIINSKTKDTLVIKFSNSEMQSGYYGRIPFQKGFHTLTVPQKQTAVQPQTVSQIKDSVKKDCIDCDKLTQGYIYDTVYYYGKLFTGQCCSYYSNGKKKVIANYIDGLPFGYFGKWDESGKIVEEGTTTNKVGYYMWRNSNVTVYEYYNDGKLKSKKHIIYKYGVPYDLKTNEWYENGNKKSVITYDTTGKYNRKLKEQTWYSNGKKQSKTIYNWKTKMITTTEWDAKGKKEKNIGKMRNWDR